MTKDKIILDLKNRLAVISEYEPSLGSTIAAYVYTLERELIIKTLIYILKNDIETYQFLLKMNEDKSKSDNDFQFKYFKDELNKITIK